MAHLDREQQMFMFRYLKFRKPKAGYVFSLLAALLVVAVQACNEQMPTAPDMGSSAVVAPMEDLKLGDVLTTLTSCLKSAKIVEVDIGPAGGSISLCGNSLVVPAHSLSGLTHIIMLPVLEHPGSVQFFPEGLHFSTSHKPTLTLSTDPVGNPANPYIVYTDDHGNVLERFTTKSKDGHSVTADIEHFSRYAVAW